jgi:hypothetical protein
LSHLIDRIMETSNIQKVLGIGNSYSNIIASFAFALVSFFYVFTISSYFKVSISLFVGNSALQVRVLYNIPFQIQSCYVIIIRLLCVMYFTASRTICTNFIYKSYDSADT